MFCYISKSLNVLDSAPLPPGEARLVGASSNKSGRLEVYLNGRWGAVCDIHLTDRDASVICRQLRLGYKLQTLFVIN